jgi:hypothetical protein
MSTENSCRYSMPPVTAPAIHLGHIPPGYAGTKKTVDEIQFLIRSGAKDFYVRQKAIDVLLECGVPQKDYLGEINAVFEWVQRNVRYTKDPFKVEVLHSARRMLELRAGDCDDMAILLGAMLEAIGHPVRLVLTGPTPQRPSLFTHIYVEAWCQGQWIPLDPTMPHPMGWAPRALVKQVTPIERESHMIAQSVEQQTIEGLGAAAAVPSWLQSLLQALRGEAIQPRDARVKSLWDLLRQRRALGRFPWLKAVLRRIWTKGLIARPRPRTTARIEHRLRTAGILPGSATAPRPFAPAAPARVHAVRVRAVGKARVVPVRPLRTLRRVARASLPSAG